MTAIEDERWMKEALRQARKGRPSPNPHVGAVVVRGGQIVGRGYHRAAGKEHAEVAALLDAGRKAKGSELFVTFEPCNHHGRTPPCTEAIINAKIKRVVVGARDPVPHRKGATAKLRRAGIEVVHGVCGAACDALVRDFVLFMREGRPCVTLKSAVSLDGRTATANGQSKWITGAQSRREVHRMRANHDAVLVGAGTVAMDDPELTVRDVRGPNPIRVVLDTKATMRPESRLAQSAGDCPVVLFHGKGAPARSLQRLSELGVQTVKVRSDRRGLRLSEVLSNLAGRDIVRLLVEGGSEIHGSFLRAELVDRVACFVAPMIMGDAAALPLARGPKLRGLDTALRLTELRRKSLGQDTLIEGWVDARVRQR